VVECDRAPVASLQFFQVVDGSFSCSKVSGVTYLYLATYTYSVAVDVASHARWRMSFLARAACPRRLCPDGRRRSRDAWKDGHPGAQT
jgi:hypothetical protein